MTSPLPRTAKLRHGQSKSSSKAKTLSSEHAPIDVSGAPVLDEPASIATIRSHPVTGPILDHHQLRQAIKITRLSHRTPGLQMWTGAPGVGKTVAAEQLALECNQEADEGVEGAYRAHYFHTGGDVDRTSGRQMKRGIYTAYEQLVDELSSGELRQRSETSLATEIVEHVRLTNTQLLIIDEAGTKTAPEIRGLALISDIAREKCFPFSILLVGMDDLAAKMTSLPVLTSRTRSMQTFRSWAQKDALAYIMSRAPILAGLYAEKCPGTNTLLQIVLRETKCAPRDIETLLPEIEKRLSKRPNPKKVIEAILWWRNESRERALGQAAEYQSRRRQPLLV